MLDRYQAAENFYTITAADGATQPFNGLIVGVAGNIAVKKRDGVTVTIAVPAGYNPLCGRNIESTGTTATGLVGLL